MKVRRARRTTTTMFACAASFAFLLAFADVFLPFLFNYSTPLDRTTYSSSSRVGETRAVAAAQSLKERGLKGEARAAAAKSPKKKRGLKGQVIDTHSSLCPQRRSMLQRAELWHDENIPYNYNAFLLGYRTQYSGYLAFAWNVTIPHPTYTPRCYDLERRNLAHAIPKDHLRPGDAMVCNIYKNPLPKHERPKKKEGQQLGGHCLMFEKWTNESRTAYVGWELCNDRTCSGVTRRVIPYPYYYKQSCWEPMRRVNVTC